MKTTMIALAALALSAVAFAGQGGGRNDGSRWIQLKDAAMISGVKVRPGSYTLSWTRQHGSEDVNVTLRSGRKVVATANGRWVESAEPSSYEALVYHREGGSNELSEIRFLQSPEKIRIDGGSTRADSGEDTGTATN